jgi:hypothetical protein
LRKRESATGYDPHYFAAFELPTFDKFERGLRDFVDACIAHRTDDSRLTRELGVLLAAPNIVNQIPSETLLSRWPVADLLKAPRVFISYSHDDKQSVLDLYHRLKESSVELWLDQFELSPGVLFQETIEKALRTSDAVLMVLSKNSDRSTWISFEGSFFYGRSGNRPIIPVVLDDEGKSLVQKLPFLRGRLYVDLTNAEASQASFDRLRAALTELPRG